METVSLLQREVTQQVTGNCILAEPATSTSVISGVTQLWKTNMAGKVTIPDPRDAINETFVLLPGNYH